MFQKMVLFTLLFCSVSFVCPGTEKILVKSGEKILIERFSDDETKQYYDIIVWRGYLNGTLVTSSSSVALNDGDSLELQLEIDTTSTVLYEIVD